MGRSAALGHIGATPLAMQELVADRLRGAAIAEELGRLRPRGIHRAVVQQLLNLFDDSLLRRAHELRRSLRQSLEPLAHTAEQEDRFPEAAGLLLNSAWLCCACALRRIRYHQHSTDSIVLVVLVAA